MTNADAIAICEGLIGAFSPEDCGIALSAIAEHLSPESLECLVSTMRLMGLKNRNLRDLVDLADTLEDQLTA